MQLHRMLPRLAHQSGHFFTLSFNTYSAHCMWSTLLVIGALWRTEWPLPLEGMQTQDARLITKHRIKWFSSLNRVKIYLKGNIKRQNRHKNMVFLRLLSLLSSWESPHVSLLRGEGSKMVEWCVVCLNENALLSSLSSRGLHFSGRTQKQVLDYVKEGGHKKVQFER